MQVSRKVIGVAMCATMALGTAAWLAPVSAAKHRGGGGGGEPAIAPAPQPLRLNYDPPAKPNVIFILADDMGYGDLNVMGNKMVPTPGLDGLANSNTILTQFYDPSPICSASRAGFMTGQFSPHNHFVRHLGNHDINVSIGQADALDPRVPTLARTLHDAGYATGHFGKWHLGGGDCVPTNFVIPAPSAYGFDVAVTANGGGGNVTNGGKCPAGQTKKGQGEIDAKGYAYHQRSEEYVNLAMNFIQSQKTQKPFFADIWFNAVHVDWRPNDAQRATYRNVINIPAGSPYDNAAERDFLTILADMDHHVGRLVDFLKASKYKNGESLYDHTVILFTSDNGPTWRLEKLEKGKDAGIVPTPGSANYISPDGHASVLTGRKASLYEGGVRQGLVVHVPGVHYTQHRDNTTIGMGVDLLPTLVDYLGITPKTPIDSDGVSILQAWKGQPIATRPTKLFWAYGYTGVANHASHPAHVEECSPGFSVRDGNYKILANPVSYQVSSADQIKFRDKPEIYDIAKTVVEHGNELKGADYDRVAQRMEQELRDGIYQYVTKVGYPPMSSNGKVCPTHGSTTHLRGNNDEG